MKKINRTVWTVCTLFLASTSLNAQRYSATLRIRAGSDLHFVIVRRFGPCEVNYKSDTVLFVRGSAIYRCSNIQDPEEVNLVYGDRTFIRLWLNSGDDLAVDLSGSNPLFEGASAVFAEYFIAERAFWLKTFENYKTRNTGFDSAETRFSDQYFLIGDSITNQRMKFVENYFCKRNAARYKNFVERQRQELLYANLYYKLAFDGTDVNRFACYRRSSDPKRTNSYAFSDRAVFNDSRLFSVLYYREFVSLFISEIARRRLKESNVPWNFDSYADSAIQVANELSDDPAGATELKAIFLNDLIEDIGRERKPAYMAKTDELLRSFGSGRGMRMKLIREKFEKIFLDTRFNEGRKAPDFELKDVSGKIYTLGDFIGKKIYLDINASWCGPCMAGIPAWNKLVAENRNRSPVVFISVSIDHDEAAWKTMLKGREISGLTLFAGKGGFNSRFALDYNITGIPHFLLLDGDGKIIRYSAPRPDDDEISIILAR